ncbi:MAG: hypothetical protein ACREXK_04560 [Gammaproteobacteria bacterium]
MPVVMLPLVTIGHTSTDCGAIIMAPPGLSESAFKKLFKEALTETLQEQRELLHDVFAEVLEDIALAEAIREGQRTEQVAREEIFKSLERNG